MSGDRNSTEPLRWSNSASTGWGPPLLCQAALMASRTSSRSGSVMFPVLASSNLHWSEELTAPASILLTGAPLGCLYTSPESRAREQKDAASSRDAASSSSREEDEEEQGATSTILLLSVKGA